MTRRAVVAVPPGTAGTPAAAEPPGPPPLPPSVRSSAATEPSRTGEASPSSFSPPAAVLVAVFCFCASAAARSRPARRARSRDRRRRDAFARDQASHPSGGDAHRPATPGPDAAADATVGAPGFSIQPPPSHAGASTSACRAARRKKSPRSSAPSGRPGRPERVDAVYATRRACAHGPVRSRRALPGGRYIGSADDGTPRGSRQLEFEKSGTHYVRRELPGYRDMHLQIDVHTEGGRLGVDDEELDRSGKAPTKSCLRVGPDHRRGRILVSHPMPSSPRGGRALGPASSYGPGIPLRLRGPGPRPAALRAGIQAEARADPGLRKRRTGSERKSKRG